MVRGRESLLRIPSSVTQAWFGIPSLWGGNGAEATQDQKNSFCQLLSLPNHPKTHLHEQSVTIQGQAAELCACISVRLFFCGT